MSVVSSLDEYLVLESNPEKKFVLFFWASWHETSKKGGQLQEIYSALGTKYPTLTLCLVEAEIVLEISERLEIVVVPTFVAMIGTDYLEHPCDR